MGKRALLTAALCSVSCAPHTTTGGGPTCLKEATSSLAISVSNVTVTPHYDFGAMEPRSTGDRSFGLEPANTSSIQIGERGESTQCTAAISSLLFWVSKEQLVDGAQIPLAGMPWWFLGGGFASAPSGPGGGFALRPCADCTGTLTVHGPLSHGDAFTVELNGTVNLFNLDCSCDGDGGLLDAGICECPGVGRITGTHQVQDWD